MLSKISPLLFALLLAACGPAPDSVSWSVNADKTVAHCSNGHDTMTIGDFPKGWWCHWDCAPMHDSFQQVYVDIRAVDGHFVAADKMPVYTGQCFDSSMKCPTCNFE